MFAASQRPDSSLPAVSQMIWHGAFAIARTCPSGRPGGFADIGRSRRKRTPVPAARLRRAHPSRKPGWRLQHRGTGRAEIACRWATPAISLDRDARQVILRDFLAALITDTDEPLGHHSPPPDATPDSAAVCPTGPPSIPRQSPSRPEQHPRLTLPTAARTRIAELKHRTPSSSRTGDTHSETPDAGQPPIPAS